MVITGSHILGIALSLVALLVSSKFSFFHTSAKFLGIVTTLVVASFFVVQKKLPFYTASSKRITISIIVALLCSLVALALSKMGEPVTGLSLILLWALMAFSVSAFSRSEGAENFITNLLIFQVPIIVCTFFTFLHHEIFVRTYVRPFFGNPNVASNFIALSILQILLLAQLYKQKLIRNVLWAFCLLGIFLLYSHGSRGPALGFIFGFIVFLFLSFENYSLLEKLRKKKALLFLTVCLVLSGLGFWMLKKGSQSMEIRYSFWRNTLCLIQDHPLGVGAGSFEYVFQRYNGRCYAPAEASEGLLVRNPHNMYLEFVAEMGIVGALAFFLFFFFLASEVYKNRKSSPLASRWVLSLGAVILGIAAFEFPQDTPYTLFFIAVLTGVALSLTNGKKNPRSQKMALLNLAASVVVAGIFFTKAFSDHLTLYPGPDRLKGFDLACSLNKENWRACVFLGLEYVQQNDFDKAEAVIALLSKNFEGHHSLMHLRGSLADKKGDFKTACEESRKYHQLFNGNSSKKEYLEKHCTQR